MPRVATALDSHPSEAARHWLRAYEPARARAAALRAAAAEETAGAGADALAHLELAIELAVPATPGPDQSAAAIRTSRFFAGQPRLRSSRATRAAQPRSRNRPWLPGSRPATA